MPIRKKTGETQDILRLIFDVDQGTVSRCLKVADPILSEIHLTGKIAELNKKTKTSEKLEEIIPDNTIIVDGTEVPRQRPADKDERKTYSGKKKQFTFNTTVISNKKGLILNVGKTFKDCTHDLTRI